MTRGIRAIGPGDIPASGAQLPRLTGRAFAVPVPADTSDADHADDSPEIAQPPAPAGPDVIAVAGAVMTRFTAAGTKVLGIGRIFANPPYEHRPGMCGAIRKVGMAMLACRRKPHRIGKHHDRGFDWI